VGETHRSECLAVPQGGIHSDETPEEALFRELGEEIGLEQGDVEILAHTRGCCATVCRTVISVATPVRCVSARSKCGFCCVWSVMSARCV